MVTGVTSVPKQNEGDNMGEKAVCRNTAAQTLNHLQPAGKFPKHEQHTIVCNQTWL